MTIISYIAAILLFCVMIAIHEFGHFATAKLFGIKVNEFSIGMGPLLLHTQKGETEYSVRALPIGGFCAIEGEDGEGDDERSFGRKPWWQRIIVLAAGAFMNILLCFVILISVLTFAGQTSQTLSSVVEGSPAWEAGIRGGDRITAVNHVEYDSWADVVNAINASEGKELVLTGVKDGIATDYVCTPVLSESGRYMVGINAGVEHNAGNAFKATITIMKSYSTAMFDWLNTLVHGQASRDDVAGVVGIVSMTAEQAKMGLVPILFFMAMISLNLGIVNLLPVPALDGGRILFVIIRTLSGGRLSAEAEGLIHGAGMVLLMGLMVFLAINDVSHLIN